LAIFEGLQHQAEKISIWDQFYLVIFGAKDDTLAPIDIKSKTREWLKNFLKTVVDRDTSVTPYTHIFVSHLHQQADYLRKKGLSVNSFSMQGLEKQNDFTTTYFQRCSNKKGDIIKQVFSKRTRIEILTFVDEMRLLQLLTSTRPVADLNEEDSSEEIEL